MGKIGGGGGGAIMGMNPKKSLSGTNIGSFSVSLFQNTEFNVCFTCYYG